MLEQTTNGAHRVTADTQNERVYLEEYRCHKCRVWFDAEVVIHALPDGTLNTDTGDPYCQGCLPEEQEESYVR